MALMNTPRFYELGPVRMADLRQQSATAAAMGNIAGARILDAQIEVISAHWDLTLKRHRPATVHSFSGRSTTKIDTQGR